MLLGIDIGGTTISLGLVKGTGIEKRIRVPSFPADATLEDTLSYLSDQIASFLTPDVSQIGIGVPTLVDVEKGIVYDALNIPSWKEVHLKEYLEHRFSIPVAINNDANCYTLGAAARIGKRRGTVVGVTLGTGTGIGIVEDGRLFCGDHCGAGEICSLPYEGSILEAFCSKQFFENRGLNSRKVCDAAAAGDKDAVATLEEFGRHLGYLLFIVMLAYDPSAIVIGGGVANAHPFFYDAMVRSLRELYPYPHVLDTLDIVMMPEEDTALIGASIMSLQYQ